MIKNFCFSALLLLSACSTEWGYKMPTGQKYAAVSSERVEVLFSAPTHPFKQIGIVSVLGSTFSSDVAVFSKLRKAAADLGADAVVIIGQSQGIVSAPTFSTTTFYAAGNSVMANTSSSPSGPFSYPKCQGIAIKYN